MSAMETFSSSGLPVPQACGIPGFVGIERSATWSRQWESRAIYAMKTRGWQQREIFRETQIELYMALTTSGEDVIYGPFGPGNGKQSSRVFLLQARRKSLLVLFLGGRFGYEQLFLKNQNSSSKWAWLPGAAWSWASFPVPGCEHEGIGGRGGCLKVTLLGIQTSKPDLQPWGLRAPPAQPTKTPKFLLCEPARFSAGKCDLSNLFFWAYVWILP